MTPARRGERSVVAVMAKQPAPGRTKTRLSPPLTPLAAAQLYEALLNDTIALVSGLHGLRLAVAVTPGLEAGGWAPAAPDDAIVFAVGGRHIGECLVQTFDRLYAAGFSHVIAINSDGPTLPAFRIRQADALLDRHDLVLGPSEDGGYYLVGLREPKPELFSDVRWSTAAVLAQTCARAAALGLSVGMLPAWYDVDTGADLDRLRLDLAHLPPSALRWTRRFFARGQRAIEGKRLLRGDRASYKEDVTG